MYSSGNVSGMQRESLSLGTVDVCNSKARRTRARRKDMAHTPKIIIRITLISKFIENLYCPWKIPSGWNNWVPYWLLNGHVSETQSWNIKRKLVNTCQNLSLVDCILTLLKAKRQEKAIASTRYHQITILSSAPETRPANVLSVSFLMSPIFQFPFRK